MLIPNKETLIKQFDAFAEYLTGYSTQDPCYFMGKHLEFNPDTRYGGADWPLTALTMIGVARMKNIRELLLEVIEKDIPGDFIETGVWRGGACIFAASILRTLKIKDRSVWVCDSFEGLPVPDPKYPHDFGDLHYTVDQLAISLEEVQSNFKKFDLLTDQVKFAKGWFCDTLPNLKAKQFSIVRLDGDMYGSTIDGLENLYPKLSPGGYIIIDDYALKGAWHAVHDYRKKYGITEPILPIADDRANASYWQKT